MLTKPGVVDRSQPASFLIHTSGKETDMATQRISAYQYWIVFGGAESVWAVLVGTWWYWVCINLVVLGIKCNWVGKKAFMPVHIEKSGDLVGCYQSGTDNKQTNEEG